MESHQRGYHRVPVTLVQPVPWGPGFQRKMRGNTFQKLTQLLSAYKFPGSCLPSEVEGVHRVVMKRKNEVRGSLHVVTTGMPGKGKTGGYNYRRWPAGLGSRLHSDAAYRAPR